ncbi:hypothetical protein TIFTF001_004424 [Ficus carica]|uniref:Uncharacterized protein n=1 Tax=Ficus carica TaxID=3494 RepID=A0AA87ZY15_FICCA|nr:hypothetical protein TIFTF001_004424 [Ficus carica]
MAVVESYVVLPNMAKRHNVGTHHLRRVGADSCRLPSLQLLREPWLHLPPSFPPLPLPPLCSPFPRACRSRMALWPRFNISTLSRGALSLFSAMREDLPLDQNSAAANDRFVGNSEKL